MTTGAAEAAQSLLLQELRAEQILTGKDFDERRRVVNAAVDRVPAMIVRPESVDDVATAVRIARRCNLPISVRGGGHDWSGRAIRSSGLVVDMGGMCSVDIEGDVALVAGGATSDHVLAAAREHGLSAALGTVGTVGVVGLILGGGYSTLLGVTGLGVDNLLSAEVVLADGSVVVADADHEAELFWALRGGGGNFGVVTSIRIRLHAIADVYAGTVAFSRAEAQQVLLNLRVLHDTLDDALDVMFGAIHTGDAPVLFTSPVWAGPADEDQLRSTASDPWAHRYPLMSRGIPSPTSCSRTTRRFPWAQLSRWNENHLGYHRGFHRCVPGLLGQYAARMRSERASRPWRCNPRARRRNRTRLSEPAPGCGNPRDMAAGRRHC